MEFGPSIEEFSDGFCVEFSDKIIVPGRSFAIHIGEADLSGRLDVEDVGFFVPTPFVVNEGSEGIVEDEGTVLVESAEEGGASWSSVEPDEDWVFFD